MSELDMSFNPRIMMHPPGYDDPYKTRSTLASQPIKKPTRKALTCYIVKNLLTGDVVELMGIAAVSEYTGAPEVSICKSIRFNYAMYKKYKVDRKP